MWRALLSLASDSLPALLLVCAAARLCCCSSVLLLFCAAALLCCCSSTFKYQDPQCYSANLNHVVLVVGYFIFRDDGSQNRIAPPFWIVRNSWGVEWGDRGHMRMDIQGGDGVCGINVLPGIVPIVKIPKDPCGLRSYKGDGDVQPTMNPCGRFTCRPVPKNDSNSCDCVIPEEPKQPFAEVANGYGSNICAYGEAVGSNTCAYGCLRQHLCLRLFAPTPVPMVRLFAPTPVPMVRLFAPTPLPMVRLFAPTPLPMVRLFAPTPVPMVRLFAPTPVPMVRLFAPTPLPMVRLFACANTCAYGEAVCANTFAYGEAVCANTFAYGEAVCANTCAYGEAVCANTFAYGEAVCANTFAYGEAVCANTFAYGEAVCANTCAYAVVMWTSVGHTSRAPALNSVTSFAKSCNHLCPTPLCNPPVDVCGSYFKNPCAVGTCINDGKGAYSCICPPTYISSRTIPNFPTCDPVNVTATSMAVSGVNWRCSDVYPIVGISYNQFKQQNPGDTCRSMAYQLIMTRSKLMELNPGLDCAVPIKPGRSVCIERSAAYAYAVPLCLKYGVMLAQDSCERMLQGLAGDVNATTWAMLYRTNPGLVCSQVIPTSIAAVGSNIGVQVMCGFGAFGVDFVHKQRWE
ncbi:unnamed protein product [Closterium sp. Naga37s-1]|nr:unnamed protein product [Closterium sp. Naga37s-1]